MIIRDATIADYPEIVRLNKKFVHYLAPMDETLLILLHKQARLFKVAQINEKIGAFIIVLTQGKDYDSENYLWFSKQYSHFLYVDRIVVDTTAQAAGIGSLLYQEVFDFANSEKFQVVCAEIDMKPPNKVSLQFHKKQGFEQVGKQWIHNGEKQVSLQAVQLY